MINSKLAFDEDTFRFSINEPGKDPYDFNTLSSGYAAIMDVVVDIMIRMERYTGRKFQYNLQGIVLIDEIEAHLHLELQKTVMKLLTNSISEYPVYRIYTFAVCAEQSGGCGDLRIWSRKSLYRMGCRIFRMTGL